MLNNIVDNFEQCGQHNIVRCCFHHLRTGCAILAVYFYLRGGPFDILGGGGGGKLSCKNFFSCKLLPNIFHSKSCAAKWTKTSGHAYVALVYPLTKVHTYAVHEILTFNLSHEVARIFFFL